MKVNPQLTRQLYEYYRRLDRLEVARRRLQATEDRIAEVEKLKKSGELHRSQGVTRYEPNQARAQAVSDPTHAAYVAYEQELAYYEAELSRLRLRVASFLEEIGEISEQQAEIDLVFSRLPEEHAQVLEQRYRYRKSFNQIAIETDTPDSTLRTRAYRAIELLEERLLGTGGELVMMPA
jgi:DNA-directed RNA polymerase specialized sigma24 family protein